MVIAMQILVLIFGVIPVSQVCCNLEKFGPQHIKIKVTQLSYPMIPNFPKGQLSCGFVITFNCEWMIF